MKKIILLIVVLIATIASADDKTFIPDIKHTYFIKTRNSALYDHPEYILQINNDDGSWKTSKAFGGVTLTDKYQKMMLNRGYECLNGLIFWSNDDSTYWVVVTKIVRPTDFTHTICKVLVEDGELTEVTPFLNFNPKPAKIVYVTNTVNSVKFKFHKKVDKTANKYDTINFKFHKGVTYE